MPAKRSLGNSPTASIPTAKRQRHDKAKDRGSNQFAPALRAPEIEGTPKFREWLDQREQDPKRASVFNVDIFPESGEKAKSRKERDELSEQLRLGREHMTVRYRVYPSAQWDRLHRYKKFTIGNETHSVHSCVLVKHEESGINVVDVDKHWKAQVLEVRALDETHVYLRVVWLEIPRELPNGAKEYHAKNELIVSNEMAVIDAMSVSGGLECVYWDGTNDEESPPNPDVYFWRQQYESKSKSLTQLREICECKRPLNPDHLTIRCTACAHWLHAKCIIESAKSRQDGTLEAPLDNGVVNEAQVTGSAGAQLGKGKRKGKWAKGKKASRKANANADAANETSVEVVEEGITIKVAEDGGKPKLVIKDTREEQGHREEDVRCLLCEQIID